MAEIRVEKKEGMGSAWLWILLLALAIAAAIWFFSQSRTVDDDTRLDPVTPAATTPGAPTSFDPADATTRQPLPSRAA